MAPLNMKLKKTLPGGGGIKGSVDVTFACMITHQKHNAQPEYNMQSVLDIFIALSVFTDKLIREQEIK